MLVSSLADIGEIELSTSAALILRAFQPILFAPGQFLLKDLVLLAASVSFLFASVQDPWLNVQKS